MSGGVKFPSFADPYVALTWHLSDLFSHPSFRKLGEVPVETWLMPTPKPEDLLLVTPVNYAVFIDSNGCKEYADKVKAFVQEKIDGVPVMIGVDHSSTGGVVEALAERYGRDNLSIIVLDSHSDFLPMELRYKMIQHYRRASTKASTTNSFFEYDSFLVKRSESYNSGTFIYYMIKDGIILPEKIILVGVSDRPPESLSYDDPGVTSAIEFYHDMEGQGVQIVTRDELRKKGLENILSLLRKKVNSPNLYISIDIDIGAISAVYGAREILNPPIIGLNTRQLYRVAKALSRVAGGRNVKLVGLDLMETDVYKAGMPLRSGKTDRTYEVEANLIRKLLETN